MSDFHGVPGCRVSGEEAGNWIGAVAAGWRVVAESAG